MSEPTPATKKISAAELARQKNSAPAPAAKAAVKKVAAAKPAATKTAPVAKAKVVAKTTTAKTVAPSAQKSAVPAKSSTPAKTTAASRKAPQVAAPQASKTATAPVVAKKARPAATTPVARPVNEEKTAKIKLIRDSFTIPENEYAAIGEIKKACLALGVDVKRTEVIRAGLLVLQQMSAAAIADYIGKQLPKPKTGRPKKAK
jgi:hypothetical protein